jgi:hypothetical protein
MTDSVKIAELEAEIRKLRQLLHRVGDDPRYDCLESDLRVTIYDALETVENSL